MVLGKIKKQPTLPPIEEPSVIEPPTTSFGGLPLPSPERVYGPVWAQAAEEANYLAYIYYGSGPLKDYVPVFPEYQFTYSTYTKTYNEMSPGEQSAFERRLAGAEAVAREGSTVQGSWAGVAPEEERVKLPKEPLEVLPEKPEGMAPHIWAKILAQEFPFGYEEPETPQQFANRIYTEVDELERMLTGDMPVGERIRIEQELAELYRYLPSDVLLEKPGGEYGLAGFELAEREKYEALVEKLKDVLPEMEVADILEYMATYPQGFMMKIQSIGRNDKTVALLKALGYTDKDIYEIFGEFPIPTYEEWEASREEGYTVSFGPWSFKLKWPWEKIDQEAYEAYVETLENMPVFVRAFVGGMGDLAQIAAGAANWLGWEGIAQEIKDTGIADALKLYTVSLVDDDPEKLSWQDVYVGAFRALPLTLAMLPAFFLGAAAGAGGAAVLGISGFARTVIAALVGGQAGSAVEGAMEAGAVYDEALAQGMTVAEANEAANQTFRNNWFLLTGTNTAQLLLFLAPGGRVLNSLARRGLVQIIKDSAGMMVVQGLTEAGEEFVQEIIQRRALGEEFELDQEAQLATIIGGIMGLGFGSTSLLYHTIRTRVQATLSPEQRAQFDIDFQRAIAAGMTREEANVVALNNLAATVEGKKIIEAVCDQVKIDEMEKLVVAEPVVPVEPAVPAEAEVVAPEVVAPTEVVIPESVEGKPEAEVELPEQVPGWPEAGVQMDIEGKLTTVYPKGRGVPTQMGMDDYQKLMELRAKEAVPEVAIPEGVKEPWQMTRAEFLQSNKAYREQSAQAQKLAQARGDLPPGSSRAKVTTANARWTRAAEERESMASDLREKHKQLIQQALTAGNLVPSNVLAEYPTLAQQAKVIPTKPSRLTPSEKVAWKKTFERQRKDAAEKSGVEIASNEKIREQLKAELDDVQLELTQKTAELEALRELLAIDPVASYRGFIGKKKTSLLALMRGKYGDFPAFITTKEAQFLLQGKLVDPTEIVKEGRNKGKVQTDHIFPEMAEAFRMTEAQLKDHLAWIRDTRETIDELWRDVKVLAEEETELRQRLQALGLRIEGVAHPRPIPEILEETGRRSLGAMAMPEAREELARRIFEKAKGEGVYKDYNTIRQVVNNLSDADVRRALSVFRRADAREAYQKDLGVRKEIAKRQGTPKGFIDDISNYKSTEEINRAIWDEFYAPIEDCPLDVAAVTYYRTGNFGDFERLLPKVDELKLKALTDDVLRNITELEDLIAFSETTIAELEERMSRGELSRRKIKATNTEIGFLQQDIGNVTETIKGLRGGKQITIEDAAILGIALRETKGGKIVPALRKSGLYASEEYVNSPYTRDVSYGWGMAQSVGEMFANIDGGRAVTLQDEFIGVNQKYIELPTNRLYWAGQKYLTEHETNIYETFDRLGMTRPSKEMQVLFRKLILEVSTHDATLTTEQLLAMPKIKELLAKYDAQTQSNLVELAQFARAWFDTVLEQQNMIRRAMGREEIRKWEKYLPEIAKSNIWSRLGFINKTPADIFRRPPLPDFVKPDAASNPRAMAREGGMENYELVTDVRRLMIDYAHVAMRDIFFTPLIHNAKIHSAVLRAQGKHNSARLIEDWAAEVYAGVDTAFDRAFKALPAGRRTLWLMSKVRRHLTRAVFPLNPVWNLTVQTGSGAFTIARGFIKDPVNMIRGLDIFWDRNAMVFSRSSYSWMIKQSRAGKMAYQDVSAQIRRNLKWEGTTLDKAENAANFMTNFVEDKITAWSVRVGYYQGLQMGFKGRALMEYASRMGAETQSMYNREGKPGWLRSSIIANNFPFMTFVFQSFNFVKSTIPFISVRMRSGIYETIAADSARGQATLANRMKIWISFIAAIFVINLIVEKLTRRRPWVLSSFIPMFAIIKGAADPGNRWFDPLPLQYLGGFWEAFTSFMKYGDLTRIRKWVLRYHMIGGTQFNRIIDGSIALITGEHADIRGKPLFEVDSDDWFRALLFGPYKTEGGQEFLERYEESWLEEFLGFPLWTRVDIKEEIELALAALGETDAGGAVYDFGDLVSRLREVRVSVGETRFVESDNPFVVMFLEAEKARDELEAILDGVPDDDRLEAKEEWRRANPMKDAYLALFGFPGRIQSMAAYNFVKKWAGELGISMADLSTWIPPENIVGDYFAYTELLRAGFASGSAEVQLHRMENPEFDEWGQQAYDWKPIDKDVRSLRISVEYAALDDYYDACETTESREAVLRSNPAYAEARRLRDAYDLDFPENLVETYVEWYLEDLSGYEDDWFLIENRDFYTTMLEMGIWSARDFSKVPTRAVGGLIDQYWALSAGSSRTQFRIKHAELDAWFVITQDYKPVDKDWESVTQADIFALPE